MPKVPIPLRRVGVKALRELLALCKEEDPALDISRLEAACHQIVKASRNRGMGEALPTNELEARWYASLASGNPDYGVYGEPIYLAETWVSWALYSRKYLLGLLSPKVKGTPYAPADMFAKVATRIADLGCGIGYSTAALAAIFPRAEVYGTNLPGTLQYAVATRVGAKDGFSIQESLMPDTPLVFASEFFEHLLRPVEYLREVIAVARPHIIICANTFGPRAVGHFLRYRDIRKALTPKEASRLFNTTLRSAGYTKLPTDYWNNRPALWIRR